jgi:hypothetical protein
MTTQKFRSILVENKEKVIPGTVFSKMIIEMDESTIEQHELNLSAGDIIADWSWLLNFFLAFMSVGGISAVIFGLGYMGYGRGAEPASWDTFSTVFSGAVILIFVAVWAFLSVRGAIANKKRSYVESKRGKGNWRIVDESKWDEFYRLLQIAKKSREKELEDFMNKKLKDSDMR